MNEITVTKYIEAKNRKDYMILFSDKTDMLIRKVTSDNAAPYFTTNKECPEPINERQIAAINNYFNIKFLT